MDLSYFMLKDPRISMDFESVQKLAQDTQVEFNEAAQIDAFEGFFDGKTSAEMPFKIPVPPSKVKSLKIKKKTSS